MFCSLQLKIRLYTLKISPPLIKFYSFIKIQNPQNHQKNTLNLHFLSFSTLFFSFFSESQISSFLFRRNSFSIFLFFSPPLLFSSSTPFPKSFLGSKNQTSTHPSLPQFPTHQITPAPPSLQTQSQLQSQSHSPSPKSQVPSPNPNHPHPPHLTHPPTPLNPITITIAITM